MTQTILLSDTMLVASAFSAVSVFLLVTLTAVWVRNYRTFRTGLLLGLIAFGAVLLLENAVSLYYFLTMQALYTMDPAVQQVVTVMRVLQTVALVFLTYVTVK
ncbi:hypothetical protein [Halococcus sediminicola]|uniref:hypothetical protein n=1 Tax=Halococcus sediminicola TaxID=1264579 RepID=UPI000A5B08D1|nr:hypothetical protein [Halococcus sediminicola]